MSPIGWGRRCGDGGGAQRGRRGPGRAEPVGCHWSAAARWLTARSRRLLLRYCFGWVEGLMAKFFKGAAGRLLLRFLLGGTNAAGECACPGRLACDSYLDQEALAMVGTAFTLDQVLRRPAFPGLQQFLQG